MCVCVCVCCVVVLQSPCTTVHRRTLWNGTFMWHQMDHRLLEGQVTCIYCERRIVNKEYNVSKTACFFATDLPNYKIFCYILTSKITLLSANTWRYNFPNHLTFTYFTVLLYLLKVNWRTRDVTLLWYVVNVTFSGDDYWHKLSTDEDFF